MQLNITCPDDGETKVPYEIDLNDIKVENRGSKKVVMITDDDIGMTFKYPNVTINNLGF